LTVSEQTVALSHELAHICRCDLFWNVLLNLAKSLFFFHPLFWLIEQESNLTQEIAADELAISRQRQDPVSYGKSLVATIGKLGPALLLPKASLGATGPVKSLTRRLSAMRTMTQTTRPTVVGFGILAGALAVTGILPWRLVAAESDLPMQRVATVTITESSQGNRKTVIAAPKITFKVGQTADVQLDEKSHRVDVTIRSKAGTTPLEHAIEIKITSDSDGKKVVLAAPKVTVPDGVTGEVTTMSINGDTIVVKATVKPVLELNTTVKPVLELHTTVKPVLELNTTVKSVLELHTTAKPVK
jgi:hypothetical protein